MPDTDVSPASHAPCPFCDLAGRNLVVADGQGRPSAAGARRAGAADGRSLSPALIAEYQTQLPDKKLLAAKLARGQGLGARGQGLGTREGPVR